jgi:hypothetical protein
MASRIGAEKRRLQVWQRTGYKPEKILHRSPVRMADLRMLSC